MFADWICQAFWRDAHFCWTVIADPLVKCIYKTFSMCSVTSVVSDSLCLQGPKPTRLLCPWDSPGKNTGVGCHALFEEIFLIQGLNLHLLHCRWVLDLLSHCGSPITFPQCKANTGRCWEAEDMTRLPYER